MYVHVTGRREGMLTLGRVERVRTYICTYMLSVEWGGIHIFIPIYVCRYASIICTVHATAQTQNL